ncbi:SAV0927 family protein [Alkalihalobacterium alkalinitrilicum]|uniref:SAV0927 family protein n=1 Tax=Alkalihalobacterium alkalinitrilicum TaxID=427920 RepID=UPI0009956BEB|nr:SAV0927 family protein [Alkalihalobacterium alkalinitrilicum]
MFESIYAVDEFSNVQHLGYATEERIYNFTLVFSEQFFGKTMVICLQTGKSTLLDFDDVRNISVIKKAFHIKEDPSAHEISALLLSKIPRSNHFEEYS